MGLYILVDERFEADHADFVGVRANVVWGLLDAVSGDVHCDDVSAEGAIVFEYYVLVVFFACVTFLVRALSEVLVCS